MSGLPLRVFGAGRLAVCSFLLGKKLVMRFKFFPWLRIRLAG